MDISTRRHMEEFVGRIDDGRKLLSVAALSAGGAMILVSVVGLVHAIVYAMRSPLLLDVTAALIGFATSFVYLIFATHVFEKIRRERKE